MPAVYRRLRLLKKNGYLIHERIFRDSPGVYRPSAKGVEVAGDALGTKKIRLATFHHDMTVVDVALALEENTGGQWRTERQIRHALGLAGVGQPGHIPDGILTFADGRKIAVEVELTAKGVRRLEKIMRHYARAAEFKEVWYIAGSAALALKIQAATRRMPYVKTFQLSEVIADERNALSK